MEDNQFKFKILLEKNGEQREVKLAGSIGEQLDLLRAHGPELEPAIRKFFGDRVTEAMEAWCDEEDVRILSEQEKKKIYFIIFVVFMVFLLICSIIGRYGYKYYKKMLVEDKNET